MAKKPTISTVASGYQANTTINENFSALREAFDNTLSLDGSTPNAMEADLDLNSNDLINGGTVNAAEIVVAGVNLTDQVQAAEDAADAAIAAATLAGTSQTSAATSATNAATSATAAASSASSASSSASAASSSASAAASSASAAAASYDSFDDRYLGAKSSNPTVDNDGNALLTGALYFNTTNSGMRVYTGSAWVAVDGDMKKSTYDTDNDGIVDAAESVPFSGITSKPTTLSGYGITDAQPLDSELTALAGLVSAADKLPYFTGSGTADVTNFTTAARAFLAESTGGGQRDYLGLGTLATQNANAVSITGGSVSGITDLAIADGGTGASTAADARTNLGLGTLATQSGTFSGTHSGTSSGTNTGDQNLFSTIAVSGQSSVVADSTSDTLTLAAGTNVTITTDATTDTITISATGGGSGGGDAYVGSTNTFTASQIISVTDNSNPALRITQTGTGEAIRVEDSTNPDSTPFVVDTNGAVSTGNGITCTALSVTGGISLPAATTEARAIELGTGRTGNGNTYIDFTGDATYTDYGLRIIRGAGGANTSSQIAHRGTGPLTLNAQDAGSIDFYTNGTQRINIRSDGNIGIGNAGGANVTLQMNKAMTGSTTVSGLYNYGTIQPDATGNDYYFVTSASTAANAATPYTISGINHFGALQGTFNADSTVSSQTGFSSGATLIGATNNYAFLAGNTAAVTTGKTAYGYYSGVNTATGGGTTYGFYAAGTANNYFNGNVGVGTTSPDVKLQVANTSSTASGTWAGGTDFLKLFAGSGSAYSEQALAFQETGTDVGAKIGVKNTANGAYNIIFANRDTSSTTSTMTERMRINTSGNVGIGTGAPASKLHVSNGYLSVSHNSQATYPTYNNAYFAVGNNFTNGGSEVDFWNSVGSGFIFRKQTGASAQTELFRFGASGQLGIGGANYGTSGQTIVSGGSGAAPAWGTLGVAGGGTGATTANAGLTNLTTLTSTATAAGTTTLTNTSTYFQLFTGTTTQTVVLPVTSTLATGWTFHIINNSTGNLTVNSSGGNLVVTVIPGTTAMVTCIGTTLTTAADWEAGLTDFSTYTGTGSVVLANDPVFSTGIRIGTGGTLAAGSIYSNSNWGMYFQAKQSSPALGDYVFTNSAGTIRMAINASGALGVGSTPDYGTSGQVLTSGGTGAAPTWTTVTGSSAVMTPYTSGSGNWTIPSAGTFVLVRAWGGGGSGGKGGATSSDAGGGGGGAYAERLYLKSDLGSVGGTVAYSVAGGGAALTTAGSGNPGGNSTFGSGATLLTAYGGAGGQGNATGGGGGLAGSLFAAGSGTTTNPASTTIPWGAGDGAQRNSTNAGNGYLGGGGGGGANQANVTTAGTSVLGGAGGAATFTTSVNATAGSAPGGGGGAHGGPNAGNSGAGGAGRIEVWVW